MTSWCPYHNNECSRETRKTIKQLAAEIKKKWPRLTVEVSRGYCNTDRKIGRLRHPGKGRWGTEIVVKQGALVLLHHNNAETYRRTCEVQRWIDERARDLKKKKAK